MTLYLVRHGRPCVDPSRPASEWELDPDHHDDVLALRQSRRLPAAGAWYSSPEPKALQTARLLTHQTISVNNDLREHVRAAGWVDDFETVLAAALAAPARPGYAGWEAIDQCRRRVVAAVDSIRSAHPIDDVVLVGHGTAWTLLSAHLSGQPPSIARWRALRMPDVIVW